VGTDCPRWAGILAAALGTFVVLSPSIASSEERWDHRGSLGVFASPGIAAAGRAGLTAGSDFRARLLTDVGLTMAVGDDGNELRAYGRVYYGAPVGGAGALGYRGFFGTDRWKTFFDLEAMVNVAPLFNVGPRVGIGVVYELTSILGLFAGVGAHFGAGSTFLFVADANVSLQLRSYLLE
jgi:hypothetical protein